MPRANKKDDVNAAYRTGVAVGRSEVLTAVEKRWNEIIEHLEAYQLASNHCKRAVRLGLIGQLRGLYSVAQYAGGNSRIGWAHIITSLEREMEQ